MSEGIDVSKWQGVVDWKAVYASGRRFAVARASIASFTQDDTFVRNYKEMTAAGLVPGAYHLVSGTSSGAEQAANFQLQLKAAGFQKGMLVLDVEGWNETLNGNEPGTIRATQYLCNWIRDTYHRTPIIYTGVYWRENLQQAPDNFGAELWLSYYGTNDPNNYVPAAWASKGWKILQYSSTGSVPGVSGNCDLNRNAGTLKSLKELAGWEWDELATQAEIEAIVAREVAKATSAIMSAEVALRQDISNAAGANALRHDMTFAKLDEIKTTLSQLLATQVGEGVDDQLANILLDIDTLHKHVCHRADLHMGEVSS